MHRKEPVVKQTVRQVGAAIEAPQEELELFLEDWLGGELEVKVNICKNVEDEIWVEIFFILSIFNEIDNDVFKTQINTDFSTISFSKTDNNIDLWLKRKFIDRITEIYFEFCSHFKKVNREHREEYSSMVREIESLDFDRIALNMIALMDKYQTRGGEV